MVVGLVVGLAVGDSVVADTGHEQSQAVCAPIAISCSLPVIWAQALAFLMAPHVILVYCTILASSSLHVGTGHEQPQALCAPIAISCALPVIWAQALPVLIAPHVILVYCTILTSSSLHAPTGVGEDVGNGVGLAVGEYVGVMYAAKHTRR